MVEALQQALVLGSRTAASNLGDSSCKMEECVTGYLGNKLVEIVLPDTINNVLQGIKSFTEEFHMSDLQSTMESIKGLLPSSINSQYNSLISQYNSILNLDGYAKSIKVALNRGAEKAAPQSVDVFKSAILGMSFSNAKEVLMGNSTAATSYLHKETYSPLQSAFSPILKEPLDLLKPNQYWKPLASSYNSFAQTCSNFKSLVSSNAIASNLLGNWLSNSDSDLPYEALPEDISAYLADYATGKALDGLFLMVGKQETKLRADPWGTINSLGDFISDTVGDLLGDVFSKAKDRLL